jgi:flagellar hook-length control protein FliK
VHGILPAAPPPDRPPGPPSLSNPDRSLKQPDHAQSSFADYLAARERDANLVARGHDRNRDATSPGHHRLPAGGKDGGSLSTLPRKNGTKDPSSGSISAERDESAARRNAAKVTQHLEAVEAEHRSVEDAGKLKTGSESGFSRTNEDYLHDEVAHVGAAAVHVPSVAEAKRLDGKAGLGIDGTVVDAETGKGTRDGSVVAAAQKGFSGDMKSPSATPGGRDGNDPGKGFPSATDSSGGKVSAGADGSTAAGENIPLEEATGPAEQPDAAADSKGVASARKVSANGSVLAGSGDPRAVGESRDSRSSRSERADRTRQSVRSAAGAEQSGKSATTGSLDVQTQAGRDSADVLVPEASDAASSLGETEAVENGSRGDAPTVTIPVDLRSDATPGNRLPTLAQATESLARRLNGELGQNIVRQARIMLQDADRAELRLIIRPPELGRVRIRLQLENGHIAGRILVDNGNVREVVEQNLSALQRAFEDAGLAMGDLEVSTGDARDEGSASKEPARVTGNGGRRSGTHSFDERIEVISEYETGRHRVNLVA